MREERDEEKPRDESFDFLLFVFVPGVKNHERFSTDTVPLVRRAPSSPRGSRSATDPSSLGGRLMEDVGGEHSFINHIAAKGWERGLSGWVFVIWEGNERKGKGSMYLGDKTCLTAANVILDSPLRER